MLILAAQTSARKMDLTRNSQSFSAQNGPEIQIWNSILPCDVF